MGGASRIAATLLALAVATAALAGAASAAVPADAHHPKAAAGSRCHPRRGHRCPRHPFEPLGGYFQSAVPNSEEPAPYASFQAEQRPPSVALGRVRAMFVCEPGGARVELEGGLSARAFRRTGPTFSVTSNVVDGPIQLFEEATAGVVRFSGRFSSPTAATVTVEVSGLALPRVYPQTRGGEASILYNQTCAAGPLTYHVTHQAGRPVRR